MFTNFTVKTTQNLICRAQIILLPMLLAMRLHTYNLVSLVSLTGGNVKYYLFTCPLYNKRNTYLRGDHLCINNNSEVEAWELGEYLYFSFIFERLDRNNMRSNWALILCILIVKTSKMWMLVMFYFNKLSFFCIRTSTWWTRYGRCVLICMFDIIYRDIVVPNTWFVM